MWNDKVNKILGSAPVLTFTVEGEPASKSNSRQLVYHKGKPRFIKSKKALNYINGFKYQIPKHEMILGDIAVYIKIYYKTKRPDLDESVILDAMQGTIIKNDRQVKIKFVFWGLDRERPRTIISIYSIEKYGI